MLDLNPQQTQVSATKPFTETKDILLKQLKNNEFITQELIDEFRSCANKFKPQNDVDALIQALDSFEYERALMLLEEI
jgi:hypothetical protein